MNTIRWERFPLINQSSAARSWLLIQFNLRLAANTIEAYGRALLTVPASDNSPHVHHDIFA